MHRWSYILSWNTQIAILSLSPPSCLSSDVICHMDSSPRHGSDLQNLRDAADGASAAVPKRASRPEPDAPNCHSGYVGASYCETDIWHPANVTSLNILALSGRVQTPGADCVQAAGCGGGVAATSFRWGCRRIVSGTRAPSSAGSTTAAWRWSKTLPRW